MNRRFALCMLLLRHDGRRGTRPAVELLDLRGRCVRRFASVQAALRYVHRRREAGLKRC